MNTTEHPSTRPLAGVIVPVETRILGWGTETVSVPLACARLAVGDLIRAKVHAEWAAKERGERETVGRESASPEMLSGDSIPEAASLEEAIRTAVDGYRSGWYIVMVDGEEPGGLDSMLALLPDSAVAFIRIYPLPDARRR